ncbi:MAG: formate acetyltransferase [Chloroflexi bacterium]|nr:MAG: formate acetyltransferase [Chloroflexota bacterium]
METTVNIEHMTYQQRIDTLRATKLQQTYDKQELIGAMDHDDWALILPPPDRRNIVKTMSSSGMPITDCLLGGFQVQSNHPSGGFFGPRAVGENFSNLLKSHPVYIDPVSSIAGGYMTNFMSYRKPHWNPDLDPGEFLREEIKKYKLLPGIGATQHFCQDLKIGLDLGWGRILENIRHYRQLHGPAKDDFYAGLEAVVLGLQNWIERHADAARRMAESETNPEVRQNLLELAEINARLVKEPPATFREVCQWMLWYQTIARMYNGSGSLGRLDQLLQPYYERESAAGTLSDEEAIFHIACLLVRDTAYIQLGGPDADGKDVTSEVSYLVLEAGHRLKIPANVGVCVGDSIDPNLLKRSVQIMFEDKTGFPKFLGVERTAEGITRLGYPIELGRQRAYSGCHWSAIPGREYTLNDCVKINFAAVFEYAYNDMMASGAPPSTALLWERFAYHLGKGVDATAACLDFHMDHMHQVYPELVLDLLCYGPIEKGEDASHGGVEFYNLCLDGAALATVADSFAALEQRIENEGRLTWAEMKACLDSNWAGDEGERTRLMMRSIPRYGSGGSRADEWARMISQEFTRAVVAKPTPHGFKMVPGIFSWANTIPMGKEIRATPNGRKNGDPISHGSNPDPGFRRDGAPTAMAVAIASVQPGYGNTAPMQMELDPMITREDEGVELVANLIRTHFKLGGTQINLNIMDAQKVLEAHKDPSKYPDLVVRVTGFSAYFASLSPEFRQLVVNRIMAQGIN